MARPKADPPSHFGDLVAAAIRRGMNQFDMSGRSLARRLGKSEGYVRDRLAGKYEFSITDVENFALFIGMNPEDFIGAIDRKVLEAEIPHREGVEHGEVKTLGEILAGGKLRDRGNENVVRLPVRHVPGLDQDLAEVAYESEHRHEDDTDDKYVE